MRLTTRFLGIALALALVACAPGAGDTTTTDAAAPVSTTEAPPATTTPSSGTIDPVAFNQDMRRLWVDHVAWTRMFIVSAAADLPDTEATATRLLQNQADIGNAVAVFYGDEAGAALTALLEEHILIAADLVTAAKAGDQAAIDTASTAWYANADEIAAFLAGANPAWPEATLQEMMHGHLDQTLAEATAQLTGDFEASVAEYDHIVAHILEMADTLAAGIIAQFPEQFI
jgi:hypothetical protein